MTAEQRADPKYASMLAGLPKFSIPMLTTNSDGSESVSFKEPKSIQWRTISNITNGKPETLHPNSPEYAKKMASGNYLDLGDITTASSDIGKSNYFKQLTLINQYEFGRGIISKMKGILKNNPNALGALGSFGRTSQNIRSLFNDLKYLPEVVNWRSGMSSDIVAKQTEVSVSDYFDDELSNVPMWEQALIYAVAQANKSSGKLSNEDVKNAKKMVKLTDLVSKSAGKASLNGLDELFSIRIAGAKQILNPNNKAPTDGGPPINQRKYKFINGKYVLEQQ